MQGRPSTRDKIGAHVFNKRKARDGYIKAANAGIQCFSISGEVNSKNRFVNFWLTQISLLVSLWYFLFWKLLFTFSLRSPFKVSFSNLNDVTSHLIVEGNGEKTLFASKSISGCSLF